MGGRELRKKVLIHNAKRHPNIEGIILGTFICSISEKSPLCKSHLMLIQAYFIGYNISWRPNDHHTTPIPKSGVCRPNPLRIDAYNVWRCTCRWRRWGYSDDGFRETKLNWRGSRRRTTRQAYNNDHGHNGEQLIVTDVDEYYMRRRQQNLKMHRRLVLRNQ